MKECGLDVQRQVHLPVYYKSIKLEGTLRVDLLVNDSVIIECKSVLEMHPVFRTQAMTYLRVTNLRLALVLNFGMYIMKGGVIRVVNGLPNEPLNR